MAAARFFLKNKHMTSQESEKDKLLKEKRDKIFDFKNIYD